MSDSATSTIPSSPESQPADVREELEQDYVTHEGEPLPPLRNAKDAQRHMGALEDNVSPVMPPVTGPARVTKADEDSHDDSHDPHRELTPG